MLPQDAGFMLGSGRDSGKGGGTWQGLGCEDGFDGSFSAAPETLGDHFIMPVGMGGLPEQYSVPRPLCHMGL